MKNLLSYLKIIEREIEYQKRVYKGKTERYKELLRDREILEAMIVIALINEKVNHNID